MKQTVTLSTFRDSFKSTGRAEQFSYEGLALIFYHLSELEEDMGEEIELDVIAICCEFAEDTPENIAAAYSVAPEGIVDYLIGEGVYVGGTSAGIVYRQF
jgi:hypothetical protein